MAKKSTTTTTVEITEAQRNIVLNGLINELLDNKRYISGSEVDDEPGPLDSCCPAHLARYEQHKRNYVALKEKKKAVEDVIKLFSKGE
jgi:hypothetical protein